jgi:hypothetical protein
MGLLRKRRGNRWFRSLSGRAGGAPLPLKRKNEANAFFASKALVSIVKNLCVLCG